MGRRSRIVSNGNAWRPHSVIALIALVTAVGCAGKHRLGEYDFRDRTLAVVHIAPAHPEVLADISLDVSGENRLESVLRIGSEIAREATLHRARPRLDSAAMTVRVADRMADRVGTNASRHLRTRPVTEAMGTDYELEVRVRRYGIDADSWNSEAYFLIDADLRLLDGRTGRRIWETRVNERDLLRSTTIRSGDRSVTNVVTAIVLASMSTAEMQRELEGLADFAADRLVDRLVRALDRARR